MRVIETVSGLQQLADKKRSSGERIALVPTMGSLHEGHLSLIDIARDLADCVFVSIFVNPTQFGVGEDFATYPRSLERDLEACREAGVGVVFTPDSEEMYPDAAETWVDVCELAKPLCGASRPGHFKAVATVVGKLFLASKPHYAVFGEKDYQQLAVIRRMVRDLRFDLQIVAGPTVREPDGLALSSRNSRLSPGARRDALALFQALNVVERAFREGERQIPALVELTRHEIEKYSLAEIEYVEFCDPDSLRQVSEDTDGPVLVALAVSFPSVGEPRGRIRLIDNRLLYDC